MNELEQIIKAAGEALKESEKFRTSLNGPQGLYDGLKIYLDCYITNHPMPTMFKDNIIDGFFDDMDRAYEKLKQDYKVNEK